MGKPLYTTQWLHIYPQDNIFDIHIYQCPISSSISTTDGCTIVNHLLLAIFCIYNIVQIKKTAQKTPKLQTTRIKNIPKSLATSYGKSQKTLFSFIKMTLFWYNDIMVGHCGLFLLLNYLNRNIRLLEIIPFYVV